MPQLPPACETTSERTHSAEAAFAQFHGDRRGGGLIRAIAVDDDFRAREGDRFVECGDMDRSRDPSGSMAMGFAADVEDYRDVAGLYPFVQLVRRDARQA